jgi:hypothetical protein
MCIDDVVVIDDDDDVVSMYVGVVALFHSIIIMLH